MLYKHRRIFILNFLFFISVSLFAQNHFSIVGSSAAGKGGASVADINFWSLQNNQAGLALLDRPTGGFYFENRYLDADLSLKSVGIALPSSLGVFGVSVNYFGFSKFSEQKIGLAYARSFGERVHVGMQFDYLRTFIGNQYGSSNSATFELGVLTELSDQLIFGAHVFNPIHVELGNSQEEVIPSVYRVGLQYKPSKQLDFELDLMHEMNRPLRVLFGTSFDIHEYFELQAGLASNPLNISFGLGFQKKNVHLGIATIYHEILGVSPNATFIYSFGK